MPEGCAHRPQLHGKIVGLGLALAAAATLSSMNRLGGDATKDTLATLRESRESGYSQLAGRRLSTRVLCAMPQLPSGTLHGDSQQQLLELLQVLSVRSDLARETTTARANRFHGGVSMVALHAVRVWPWIRLAGMPRSRPSMTATLQREHWNDQPAHSGDLFRVTKRAATSEKGGDVRAEWEMQAR